MSFYTTIVPTLSADRMNTSTANNMAYVGQCDFLRSPADPTKMLTYISTEPLPAVMPGTTFPIKTLFKIGGVWKDAVAPYRMGETNCYDLPSLDLLEPFRLKEVVVPKKPKGCFTIKRVVTQSQEFYYDDFAELDFIKALPENERFKAWRDFKIDMTGEYEMDDDEEEEVDEFGEVFEEQVKDWFESEK